MDAREFVRMLVDKEDQRKAKLEIVQKGFPLRFDHCFMNLPVDAVEFLDAFIGLFNKADPAIWLRENDKEIVLPTIHVYGFSFEQDKSKALDWFVERIGKAMDYPEFKKEDIISFHNIRDVSPQSHMYSTSFKLPEKVAFAKSNKTEIEDLNKEFDTGHQAKKPKV